ncbi:disease resistance protein RPS4B-like [Malus sylvestris]|uniref:disease resistance protein RPS4B-like n=1 Tax=Malus sylvestris TaxID=3752 RepID=UPI0021AC4E82|nr:disease resistance protein RPS4B-like [Malus sylvestris]
MKSIPPSISLLKNLTYLSLHCLKWPLPTFLLPPMPVGLNSIRVLSLAGCNLTDVAIPMELRSLISLDLQGSSICSLPSLSGFSKLDTLRLNYCRRLRAIPDLPTSLEILEADECIALEKMPDFSEMSRMRVLHLNHSPKLTEIPGLHKSLKSMTRIHMEACKNLTADFRKKILQGWTSCGYGCIFLNGNYMPEWFRYFGGDEVCLVVPQSVSSNFKGLTLCCVYSSNKQSEDCPLGISIRNKTKHTAMLARITYASVPTSCDSEDHYLWQGQLSNDVLGWQDDGDEVKIFVGPVGPGDNSARVKKIAVDLVWDKFMKENMDDSHPGLYDFNPHEARASHDAFDGSLPSKILRSDNIVGDDDEAGPSNDSSDENQAPKRSRPDPGNQIN